MVNPSSQSINIIMLTIDEAWSFLLHRGREEWRRKRRCLHFILQVHLDSHLHTAGSWSSPAVVRSMHVPHHHGKHTSREGGKSWQTPTGAGDWGQHHWGSMGSHGTATSCDALRTAWDRFCSILHDSNRLWGNTGWMWVEGHPTEIKACTL